MSEVATRISGGPAGDGRAPPRRVAISDIQRAVAEHYALPPKALLAARRLRRISHPRQLAMWLARQLTQQSFNWIGDRFHRDHTTVMQACRVVPERLLADPAFRRDCKAILCRVDLIRRDNVVPFPAPTRRPGRPSVDSAIAVLAAELERDPAGTLAKLLRRTVDGPEISDR